jgi:hypothetical protein
LTAATLAARALPAIFFSWRRAPKVLPLDARELLARQCPARLFLLLLDVAQ